MELTGERFLPEMKGVIENEHFSRYFFVVNQIDLSAKIVVDLASGEGYGSHILSQYAEKVIGIDLSSEAIDHAKASYQKENLDFRVGDACNIPLKDNFADVFVSFETIEHHDRHLEMVAEIKRVLKPDGVLIISSPDKKHYSDITGYKNQYHIKELYYEEFKLLLKKFFNNNFFFLQNNFSGSLIIPDDNLINNFKTQFISSEQLANTHFEPLYNIAISTDNNGFKLLRFNLFFGNYRVLTDEDIFLAEQEILRSAEHKLGRKILKRIGFLRKFLEKKSLIK